MVYLHKNLLINTYYIYPILCALPIADSSMAIYFISLYLITFHNGSTIKTWLAIVKFNPFEYAFIDSINAVVFMQYSNS